MDITIRLVEDKDKVAFVNIFNYHIQHGYAAYSTNPVPVEAFERFKSFARDGLMYVAETSEKGVIGFALLKIYYNVDCFAKTAEVSYFILPDFTNQGLGKRFMNTLIDAARTHGIDKLVANVSSLNPQSLAFHIRQGFRQCGRLEKVGEKNGRLFDVIWFQKTI